VNQPGPSGKTKYFHVTDSVNQPGPSGKTKYFHVTDSELVP